MKLLDSLIQSIRAANTYNAAREAAPECVLWPDAEAQWASAMPLLQARMPELLILGDYNPQKRQGPAIWLRCVIGRGIKEPEMPHDITPVIYLPGVGRRDLRAVDACPKELQPLAPLQFSGVFFSQANAKDWTILAWLVSEDGGLGLDAARDSDAKDAMLAALPKLLQQDCDSLRGKRLDKDFFNSLLSGDPGRDILEWLNDEAAFRAVRTENEWRAFTELCKSRFALDPEKAGPLSAAENLLRREGPWQALWERYAESFRHFPNIETQLRKCQPPREKLDWLLAEPANASWPQWNDEQEDILRKSLASLGEIPSHECAEKLLELEKHHALRRDSLWARNGQAPMAMSLGHLAKMAKIFRKPAAAASLEDMAKTYGNNGWKMDDAALKAMAECADRRDKNIIEALLRNIYLPWLEELSRHAQKFFENNPYPPVPCETDWQEGDCILFVDGLRMDCAKNLAQLLAGQGLNISEQIYWAALPSLTATGKPAVSPVCGQISGSVENADFEPDITSSGKSLKGRFDKLLADAGWEILKNGDAGTGRGKAWAEFGELDHEGHHQPGRLPVNLPGLLAEIAKYIGELLAAGWRRVIVVTDHGWLWLPGGLPKCNLPSDLVENKWGRCAIPKSGSIIKALKMPWHWNRNFYFALANGASCFKAGQEYAHGGLSLQECLLLKMVVSGVAERSGPRIEEIKWTGLRCRLALSGSFSGLRTDIRLEPASADSSVADTVKALKDDGTVALFVEDEDNEGREAYIVLVDGENRLVAQEKTIIGGRA